MTLKKDAHSFLYDRLVDMDGVTYNVIDSMMNLDVCDVKELCKFEDDLIKSTFAYFENLNNSSIDYDVRFMRLAREVSTWSKDPKKQIGCVAVRDRQILSQGYNGFPRGIKDDWRLYIKETKLPMVAHAELNMVVNAVNNGISLKGSTVYVFGLPVCSNCAIPLIQAGVHSIVMCDSTEGNSKSWSADSPTFKLTKNMLDECGIAISFISHNRLGESV